MQFPLLWLLHQTSPKRGPFGYSLMETYSVEHKQIQGGCWLATFPMHRHPLNKRGEDPKRDKSTVAKNLVYLLTTSRSGSRSTPIHIFHILESRISAVCRIGIPSLKAGIENLIKEQCGSPIGKKRKTLSTHCLQVI